MGVGCVDVSAGEWFFVVFVVFVAVPVFAVPAAWFVTRMIDRGRPILALIAVYLGAFAWAGLVAWLGSRWWLT
jgi:hypothetical protein